MDGSPAIRSACLSCRLLRVRAAAVTVTDTSTDSIHPTSTSASSSSASTISSPSGCPPVWQHPPRFSRHKALLLVLHLIAYIVARFILDAVLQIGRPTFSSIGSLSSNNFILNLLQLHLHICLLCICGYTFVSHACMSRPLVHVWCSRYGGSHEMFKMLALIPVITLTTLIFTCRLTNDMEHRNGQLLGSMELIWMSESDAAHSFHLLHAPPFITLVLPFYLALHFTYLDGWPLLQSLGCKLPLPSLWPHLTRDEVAVTALSIIVGCGLMVPTLLHLIHVESYGSMFILYLCLSIAVLYIADLSDDTHHRYLHQQHRHRHGHGHGQQHPRQPQVQVALTGWQMWRYKLAEWRQILTKRSIPVTANGSSASPAPLPSPVIYFHFHHYLLGLLLLPLFRFPIVSSCIGVGVSLGVFVEGVACWGFDPLLVSKRPIN